MNIKTGGHLPFNFVALGVLLIFSSVFVVEVQPILAVVFIFIGIILSTTHRRLKVDLKSSYYQEFVWILGYKYGQRKRISE